VAEPSARQAEIDAMLSNLNTAPPPPPLPPRVEPPPDVLDLTESMAAPASGGFRTIDGQSDVVFEEGPSEEEVAPVRSHAGDPHRPMPDEVLISAATTAAVDSAFNTLAHTVLVQNARTLEDRPGRAAGARRDRAGLARPHLALRLSVISSDLPSPAEASSQITTCARASRRRETGSHFSGSRSAALEFARKPQCHHRQHDT
jgi:hypothetical protein